ncbi:MAG: glutamate 5-kinase, partial [Oxalobacter sp.]|nr:glutamate 5-kinase [Oxalobacter sp.]
IISCIDCNGHEVARGLANYSYSEAKLIAQHKSKDIARILGYEGDQELIHRDNMIVLNA